jgi:hypothetical protein
MQPGTGSYALGIDIVADFPDIAFNDPIFVFHVIISPGQLSTLIR